MTNDQFKQLYASLVLILTFGWAIFTVYMVYNALMRKDTIDIMASSGANIFLGALIGWNTDIKQHLFRKNYTKPEESKKP